MNAPAPATAFVTGADRGLGRALADEFARRGLPVFAGIHDPETPERLPFASANIRPVPIDIGSDASVAAASALVEARGASIDILVNCAGRLGDIERTIGDAPDFDDMLHSLNVNALGALRVTHALLGPLRRGRLKTILNISSEAASVSSQTWRRGWFGYCMSKSALNMATVLCQNALRDEGFRHLLVHPGYLKTYMHGARNENATYEAAEVAGALCDLALEASKKTAQGVPFVDHLGNPLPW